MSKGVPALRTRLRRCSLVWTGLCGTRNACSAGIIIRSVSWNLHFSTLSARTEPTIRLKRTPVLAVFEEEPPSSAHLDNRLQTCHFVDCVYEMSVKRASDFSSPEGPIVVITQLCLSSGQLLGEKGWKAGKWSQIEFSAKPNRTGGARTRSRFPRLAAGSGSPVSWVLVS